MERDTLELTLADASGKWLGDGIGGLMTAVSIGGIKALPLAKKIFVG